MSGVREERTHTLTLLSEDLEHDPRLSLLLPRSRDFYSRANVPIGDAARTFSLCLNPCVDHARLPNTRSAGSLNAFASNESRSDPWLTPPGSPGMRAANEYFDPATVNLSLEAPTIESEALWSPHPIRHEAVARPPTHRES